MASAFNSRKRGSVWRSNHSMKASSCTRMAPAKSTSTDVLPFFGIEERSSSAARSLSASPPRERRAISLSRFHLRLPWSCSTPRAIATGEHAAGVCVLPSTADSAFSVKDWRRFGEVAAGCASSGRRTPRRLQPRKNAEESPMAKPQANRADRKNLLVLVSTGISTILPNVGS